MVADERKRRPTAPTIGQLIQEVKTLRTNHDQLKVLVNKLKDILQVHDNWHSRVSGWMKKEVELFDDREDFSFKGTLLWTDRYNLGIEVAGREEIFNKGHVVRIRLA